MRGASTVVAIGGISVDMVRSSEGENGPFVGGNAVYAAVGAWLVGAHAVISAAIGSDFPSALFEDLDRVGLVSHLITRTKGPSLKVTLDYRSEPRRQTYRPDSGHNADLDPGPDQLTGIDRSWAVHICGISPKSQRRLAAALTGRTALLTLDTVYMEGEIEPEPEEMISIARVCGAFLPSREEVVQLWPGQSPREVLGMLQGRGCPMVVIKLGVGGSIGITEGQVVHMPAYPTAAVDTTGAGDAYCGAFAAALRSGHDLLRSMAWATAAASIVVESFGALSPLTERARSTVAQRANMLVYETQVRVG